MNFDLRLELERLNNQSNNLIKTLCDCEAKRFEDFKIRIKTMFSDIFPEDSIFKEKVNNFDGQRKKCIKSAEIFSKACIKNKSGSDPFKDVDVSRYQNTESGFFEASSGGTSSSSMKSDETLKEAKTLRQNKISESGEKIKAPKDKCSNERTTSSGKIDIDFKMSSLKLEDGDIELSISDTKRQVVMLEKSSNKISPPIKIETGLNATYNIVDENLETPHTPKEMPDIRIIQLNHLKNKFSYLQFKKKRQLERNIKNKTNKTDVLNRRNEQLSPIPKRHKLRNVKRKKEYSNYEVGSWNKRKQPKTKVLGNKKEVIKENKLREGTKKFGAKVDERKKNVMNRAAILRIYNSNCKNRETVISNSSLGHTHQQNKFLRKHGNCAVKPQPFESDIRQRQKTVSKKITNPGAINPDPDIRKKGITKTIKSQPVEPFLKESVNEEVAPWAYGIALKEAIIRQHHQANTNFKEEELFGFPPPTVDLEDIFGNSCRYRPRTNSAEWSA